MDTSDKQQTPDGTPAGVEELAKACDIALGGTADSVRGLLHDVLELHNGSLEESVAWLRKPNRALREQSPVDMITRGNIQELQQLWQAWQQQYGDPVDHAGR